MSSHTKICVGSEEMRAYWGQKKREETARKRAAANNEMAAGERISDQPNTRAVTSNHLREGCVNEKSQTEHLRLITGAAPETKRKELNANANDETTET
jgi:hypothetical protein